MNSPMEKKLIIYRGHYFFFFAALASITTFVAMYFKEVLGFTNAQVGMVASVYSVTGIFSQPFWGMLADLKRRPKAIAITLMCVSAVLSLLMLRTRSFPATFIVYFLFAFFYGGLMPLFDAITMNFLAKLPHVGFGQIRFLGSIGYGASALVVGYLVDATSLKAIFVIFAVLIGLSLFFTFRMENGASIERGDFSKDFKALLGIGDFWMVSAFLFFLLGTINGTNAFLGLFLLEKGQTARTVGLIFFLMAGLEMPFMIYARSIIAKAGFHRLIVFLALLSALRLYVLSLDLGVGAFIAVSASLSAVIGLTLPGALEHVAAIVPKGVFATSVSLYTALSFGLGSWLMTLAGGWIADAWGYPAIFRIYAFIALAAVALAIAINRSTSAAE